MTRTFFYTTGVVVLLITISERGHLLSLQTQVNTGINNPRYSNYSRNEIKKAAILSVAAKLENRYHSHMKNSEFREMDNTELGDKLKKTDFLLRLRENN